MIFTHMYHRERDQTFVVRGIVAEDIVQAARLAEQQRHDDGVPRDAAEWSIGEGRWAVEDNRTVGAASDLLAALEEIMGNARYSRDNFAAEVLASPLARAAIRRAKGEQ